MSNAQLTPYLLDRSLIDYTIAVTREALKISEESSEARKRADLALDFFIGLLDPAIDEEKKQLDVFLSYQKALNDPDSEKNIGNLTSATSRSSTSTDLTPAQKVLSLPDTLNAILSHIPTLSKSGRDTLYAATLTSTTFYNAAQLRLWRRPRDLDTVEQQVQFAFGVAISASFDESLGEHVKRLRIRWQKGSWNTRVIKKIIKSCPAVRELTLHWGDSEDGTESVTQESIQTLYEILGSLPNLTHLYLFKFCATPETTEHLKIPDNAYLPFSKLEELQLYDLHWYWKPICEGLGSNLTLLDIGLGTYIKGGQLATLPSKVTGLKSLRLSCSLEIQHIRYFTSALPDLESVAITQYSDREDTFVAELFSGFSKLGKLREVSVNLPIGSAQLDLLAKSSLPLEELDVKIVEGGEDGSVKALVELVNAKHQTLKALFISFQGDFVVAPTEELVSALSSCSQLERILIDFDEIKPLISDATVQKLLASCPNLSLTDSLETLVKGREIYEQKYREKLEKERDEEGEDIVLGN